MISWKGSYIYIACSYTAVIKICTPSSKHCDALLLPTHFPKSWAGPGNEANSYLCVIGYVLALSNSLEEDL